MDIWIFKEDALSCNAGGALYAFPGAQGPIHWPQEDGAGLGPVGAWNTLWRLGFRPRWGEAAGLPAPQAADVLLVCASGALPPPALGAAKAWLQAGGTLLASGAPQAWQDFFPADCVLQSARLENPYAALACCWENRPLELIAPPKWTYLRLRPASGGALELMGQLAAVHGERQTSHRALVTRLAEAPAIVRYHRFFYLNGNPFAAFQSWLQGQEDLGPWLSWRHRLFWLDEWVALWGRLLAACGALPAEAPRRGIEGLKETTVVLRHDLDSSRDTAYLEAELNAGLPGVHAILKDRNTRFWVDRLRHHPDHEAAFHYNTVARPRAPEALSRLWRSRPHPPRAARQEVVGQGLLRQVRWARRQGIGVATLHRHYAFILYPEWIDALNEVLNQEHEVLGSSTLFRGQVLRWGVDRVDGMGGTLGEFPDVQFPFWLPFKLAHAGRGGRALRGWEMTCIMEIEPELFEQMLDYPIPELPQRVISLNYHPAHAHRPTFAQNGSLPWFRRILEIIQERGLEVRTLRSIYHEANQATGWI